MSSRRVALAFVGVPSWGTTRTPVWELEGDAWTLRDSLGRDRPATESDLNLAQLVPARVQIVAEKGKVSRMDPAPGELVGAEWRAWRERRLAQLANCRRLGWRVVGWEDEKDEDAPGRPPVSRTTSYYGNSAPSEEDVELRPGCVLGPSDGERWTALRARHRTDNPKYMAWRFHQRGPEPDRWSYPDGPAGKTGLDWMPRGAVEWKPDPMSLRDSPRDMAEGISPFWYQAEAVAQVLERGHGVVEAPCGAGKTGIGTFLARRVEGRTLVVVHTLDLVRQWRERLETWLPGTAVGQLGGGKKPDGSEDVVVASLSTLARWSWEELEAFGAGFGLLVCDECHHVPAVTWIRVVSALPCASRMGLTATPERKDGLHAWMHLALGPTVYRIDQSTLDNAGRTMRPTIRRLDTDVEPFEEEHPAHTMRGLLEDPRRQSLLLRTVRELVAEGRRVLVLTSLVDHAEETADELGGAALVGSVASKRRAEVLASMRSGELSVIVATQLADEGLDLPELDTVVLSAPSSHKAATRQRVGRACRAQDGKRPPLVVDLVDAGGWAMRKWSARRSLYRSLGWPIERHG